MAKAAHLQHSVVYSLLRISDTSFAISLDVDPIHVSILCMLVTYTYGTAKKMYSNYRLATD